MPGSVEIGPVDILLYSSDFVQSHDSTLFHYKLDFYFQKFNNLEKKGSAKILEIFYFLIEENLPKYKYSIL